MLVVGLALARLLLMGVVDLLEIVLVVSGLVDNPLADVELIGNDPALARGIVIPLIGTVLALVIGSARAGLIGNVRAMVEVRLDMLLISAGKVLARLKLVGTVLVPGRRCATLRLLPTTRLPHYLFVASIGCYWTSTCCRY